MKNSVEFYDIYGYYQTPFVDTTLFKVLVVAAVVTLVLMLLFFLFLRRKKRQHSPWDLAAQQLMALSPEQYTSAQEYKEFYFKLTMIIKSYLSSRYGWTIADQTDQELVLWLESKKCDQHIIDSLKKISEGALEIKFANVQALRWQAESDKQAVLMIIKKTAPEK